MRTFNIVKPNETIRPSLTYKIEDLTKPKGALGRLEELALQIGLIQQTLTPSLKHPINLIFAADHGIIDEGVSKTPKEVTAQVVYNFLNGGAGICFLCKQHGFELKVVDAGVDYDFPPHIGLIDQKIRKGSRNFLHEAALTEEEVNEAIRRGADSVSECQDTGCNVISFGEMGAGNTAVSSIWMNLLTGIPLTACVGAGSGLDHKGIHHKYEILEQALSKYKEAPTPSNILRYFGGYEMDMAVGAMLRAAELGLVILIDGFIMTNCALMASKLYPEVIDYCIFGHCGDESGHQKLLHYMGVKPLLSLGLRLGEGSGAVCAYPIVDSAVRMINEMDTFHKAQITKYI